MLLVIYAVGGESSSTLTVDTDIEIGGEETVSAFILLWDQLCLGRPCPPKIQLESRRMGAVSIRRMATYKEVVFTKVASNHH